MKTKQLARLLSIGAAAALVVGISAIPGGSQTTPTAKTQVVAVSGDASGVFVNYQRETDETPLPVSLGDLGPLVQAVRSGDAAAAEAFLADRGDVSAAAVETFSVGPVPTVTLPPEGGGPFTESVPDVGLFNFGDTDPVSGAVEVSTEGALGPDGFARSTANIADFNPEGFDEFVMVADAVEVECRSDLTAGPTGSTRIVNGLVLETLDPELPELPAPNEVLLDEEIEVPVGAGVIRLTLQIVANEQTVDANSITVVGVRIFQQVEFDPIVAPVQLIEQTDTILGETSCGVVPGAVVEPTFTG